MPTGYTHDIPTGITFRQFALNCARAFGANVTMRDEPSDKPIEVYEPSDYHAKQVETATAEMIRLKALDVEAITSERDAEYQSSMESWNQGKANEEKQEASYRAMLAQVDVWTPPTSEHNGIKKFMVEQITESIRFDCSGDYFKTPPAKHDPMTWWANKIAKTQRDIEYHSDENDKEIKRTNERNAWNAALIESLR